MILKNDRLVKISAAGSRTSSVWNTQELYWSDFIERISRPIISSETLKEYKELSKAKQDELKDVGGFVGGTLKGNKRNKNSVHLRDLITLDADNIRPGGLAEIHTRVGSLGCAYAIYSTRKHESTKPRIRIIIPIDISCTPDEYEAISRKLAENIGMEIFDPTTFQAARLMYWPSCSKDAEYFFAYEDKPFLSKDGMLELYADWTDVSFWPEVPGAAKLTNNLLKKQGDPLEKNGVIGAFCRVYDIPSAIDKFLPDVYEPCGSDRYTYLGGSTASGVILYQEGKFSYSHHATDVAGQRLCNAFDLVRIHMFGELDEGAKEGTPANKLPSFIEMTKFALTDEAVRLEKIKEEFSQKVKCETDRACAVSAEEYDWIAELEVNDKGIIVKSYNNIEKILEKDPNLKGKFIRDRFSGWDWITGKLPWNKEHRKRCLTDSDETCLIVYISDTYKINSKILIQDALSSYLEKNAIHAVREYFNTISWDGIERLDTLLIDYLGAEDNLYTRAVAVKSLVAAVSRIFEPGTKFDNMMVIVGDQGTYKSTFVKYIGKEWYTDGLSIADMKDIKVAGEKIQGNLVVEVPEMAGKSKADNAQIKAFLSSTEDNYRPAYGRRAEKRPRQCILIGTTNEEQFLNDQTGDRRYWPVTCDKMERKKDVFRDLPKEVDQIWAEAIQRFKNGEALNIVGEVLELAKRKQQDHKIEDPRMQTVKEFIETPVPVDWYSRSLEERLYFNNEMYRGETMPRDRICGMEVWCECFRGNKKDFGRKETLEVQKILAALYGGRQERLKFGPGYGRQRGYLTGTENP